MRNSDQYKRENGWNGLRDKKWQLVGRKGAGLLIQLLFWFIFVRKCYKIKRDLYLAGFIYISLIMFYNIFNWFVDFCVNSRCWIYTFTPYCSYIIFKWVLTKKNRIYQVQECEMLRSLIPLLSTSLIPLAYIKIIANEH